MTTSPRCGRRPTSSRSSPSTPRCACRRQWTGLCPFHSEKTPSFSVNPNDNVFYCFGCQAKGDVIAFVMEKEALDFPGAVERLATKAGISLRYTDRNEGEGRKKRARYIETMARAVEWYHERLLSSPDAGAARSLPPRARGLDGDVVREFRLGWAPDAWDELTRALRLDSELAEGTGLARLNSRGRLNDHFRARIVFLIADDRGDPISFGGRILPGGEGPGNQGKYKNTTETPLYNKSKVLYGLDRSKTHIVTAGTAVICEGYTDVIGFHRAGVPLAVATCGTALTDDHVTLLAPVRARRLVLAFDADSAGQAAAERLLPLGARARPRGVRRRPAPGAGPGGRGRRRPGAAGGGGREGDAVPAVPARPGVRGRRPRQQRGAGGPPSGPRDRGRAPDRAGARPVPDGRGSRCRVEPDRLRALLEQVQARRPGRRARWTAAGGAAPAA